MAAADAAFAVQQGKGAAAPTRVALDSVPAPLAQALAALDTDGDGFVDAAELAQFARAYQRTRRANRKLGVAAAGLAVMLLLFVALSAAITFVVVDQSQQLRVAEDGSVVANGGPTIPVAVRTTRADVPLNRLHRAGVDYLANLQVVKLVTTPATAAKEEQQRQRGSGEEEEEEGEAEEYTTTRLIRVAGAELQEPAQADVSPVAVVHGARGEIVEVSAGGVWVHLPSTEDPTAADAPSSPAPEGSEVDEELSSAMTATTGRRHLLYISSPVTGGGGTGLNVQYNPTVDPTTGQRLNMGYNSQSVCGRTGGFFDDGLGFGVVRDRRFRRRGPACTTDAPQGIVLGESSLAQARDDRARLVDASVAAAPDAAVSAVPPPPPEQILYGVPRGSSSTIGGGGGGGVAAASLMPATGQRPADVAHTARRQAEANEMLMQRVQSGSSSSSAGK